MADDPAGGAAGALAAALKDPGLHVAYPAPDGTWHDHRGQTVVLPERDVTMVTDEGEIVAAVVHGSLARIDYASVTGAVSAARLRHSIPSASKPMRWHESMTCGRRGSRWPRPPMQHGQAWNATCTTVRSSA